MAYVKKTPSGTYQLCIRNRLLPKTLWATFDSKSEAETYGAQLEALLKQGIVPSMLLERPAQKQETWTVTRCIVEYQRHNSLPLSETKLLDTIQPQLAMVATTHLNYDWAEGWIRNMKREAHLSPSTIRHRQGALARCFDWMMRKHPEIMVQNPLRLLKRGFSTYTPDDVAFLARQGKGPKFAEERDRRLGVDEEMRIREVLADRPVDLTFLTLALETAMRMRECYTLDLSQVSLEQRTIYLDRSKNGDRRQVPLSSTAIRALADHLMNERAAIKERSGRLFPYWGGSRAVMDLDIVTRDLSRVFALAFEAAGAPTLHFHDLRHEATCRLYEKTKLSDVLIAKITGHRDLRMLKRYASLRGSELANHLW
jgi:integrase